MRKRVYIAYTGGTIGMQKLPDGYAPAPGYLEEQIAAMPELKSDSMPEYHIHEYDPLLDSSDMTPAERALAPNMTELYAFNFANRVSAEIQAKTGLNIGSPSTYYGNKDSLIVPGPSYPQKQ